MLFQGDGVAPRRVEDLALRHVLGEDEDVVARGVEVVQQEAWPGVRVGRDGDGGVLPQPCVGDGGGAVGGDVLCGGGVVDGGGGFAGCRGGAVEGGFACVGAFGGGTGRVGTRQG